MKILINIKNNGKIWYQFKMVDIQTENVVLTFDASMTQEVVKNF